MPIPRSGVLAAVVLMVVTLSPGGTAAGGTRDGDAAAQLRKAANKARTDLQAATRQMEDRRRALAGSQDKLRATLKDLAAADAQFDRIRGPLSRLANASYQQPGVVGSMAVFGSGGDMSALRSTADVDHLADAQQSLISQADRLQKRKQELASAAQELQSENAVAQTRLKQQIDGLKQKSAQLTAQLEGMLRKLDPDKRLELGCDKSLASESTKFPNGLIPDKFLCPLPQKGMKLRADAALAFYKVNAAYRRRFGHNMCVTSSYRSLADQHRVYAERPGFAAVPGTSNHGKGQAVDLCDGVENQGSTQFNWMKANSGKYGWFHPTWAYSNPFEPWHWEYGTDSEH
ncbi:D-alanyl-D-alanine carboxypeptidase family protein [Actinomadura rupiterrae]|uniref:D-alanyl-D-alanine carboxypeptidase family protein n=1 Tax=Actinomadura rupiterrae TaxID=559627 RepID=UPI0020A29368|nr:M15 family metallopeptidase [Actinomadura rupiterrae]MCP2336990.1 LAS superfamily LD-carboxypeptidase LdcB [Actinomadura rupiterrae]